MSIPSKPLPDSTQHNREIHENSALWERKPLLRLIYANFHAEISKRIDRRNAGLIVEIGSGIGNLKQAVPECIATDLFENPWLDQVENAYALTFADESVGNLILFDVWHHLQYPSTALREFHRVLVPGGRLIILDPAMGLVGRLVYGLFHHEPVGLNDPIEWEAPKGIRPADFPYFAAQGRAWKIFHSDEWPEQLAGWKREEVKVWSSFDYIGSGGFRGPQIYPTVAWPLIRTMDRLLSSCPRLFGSRMLIVLSKKSP